MENEVLRPLTIEEKKEMVEVSTQPNKELSKKEQILTAIRNKEKEANKNQEPFCRKCAMIMAFPIFENLENNRPLPPNLPELDLEDYGLKHFKLLSITEAKEPIKAPGTFHSTLVTIGYHKNYQCKNGHGYSMRISLEDYEKEQRAKKKPSA